MRKVSQVRNNAIICDDAQVLSITGHDRYHCACACKNLKWLKRYLYLHNAQRKMGTKVNYLSGCNGFYSNTMYDEFVGRMQG